MVLGLPTAPAPASTDDADRLQLGQLHRRDRDRPLGPAEGRRPYTHLGMTLVLDEFVQPCSSVQDNIRLHLAADALHADPGPAGDAAYAAATRAVAAVDRRWLTQANGAADGLPAPPSEACPNVENDVDLRSTPRPQHALPHVPDPTRVLSYALNNWNDNRLALALLHSAASPAQQHAVFNDLGDWRIGLVGALSSHMWQDKGDGYIVDMSAQDASRLAVFMDILMGNVDPAVSYYRDIDAMGTLYSEVEPDTQDTSVVSGHICGLGFERAPAEGGAPFPAPRLAPARHVHQADRRLRRALEAYSTILTHHERLFLYVD